MSKAEKATAQKVEKTNEPKVESSSDEQAESVDTDFSGELIDATDETICPPGWGER